jgi:hypothetical protein
MRGLALAVVILLAVPAHLGADLLLVEKSVARSGNRTVEGLRSTYIKGTRMRVEVAQGGKTAVTVYDLPAGEMLELDTPKRKAYVRSVQARNARLEKDFPRHESKAVVTASGQTRTIAGIACGDHTFAVTMPLIDNGSIVLNLDGTACLSGETDAVDYMPFARAAYDQNLVLGTASDNVALLALARGQTELYRALTEKGGVPLAVDLTTTVQGKGILAGLLRKVLSGSRVTTASRVDSAPVGEALFAVPAGWKRELKK